MKSVISSEKVDFFTRFCVERAIFGSFLTQIGAFLGPMARPLERPPGGPSGGPRPPSGPPRALLGGYPQKAIFGHFLASRTKLHKSGFCPSRTKLHKTPQMGHFCLFWPILAIFGGFGAPNRRKSGIFDSPNSPKFGELVKSVKLQKIGEILQL